LDGVKGLHTTGTEQTVILEVLIEVLSKIEALRGVYTTSQLPDSENERYNIPENL
jgi:hypothetical protein